MEISFLGAADEVGRSCFIVKGRKNTMLDCGIKVSSKETEFPLLEDSDVKQLDNLVVSHAHVDHCGYAPWLHKHHYKGKVFLTKPTHDLSQLLLADYLRIAKDFSPYTQADITSFLKNNTILEYEDERVFAREGIKLHEAGHILGSAITELSEEKTLVYSGDFNTRSTRLLEPAQTNLRAQILVLEGTYGAKTDLHPSTKDSTQAFINEIKQTINAEGKVIIPTFATGRGQEVLFTIESHIKSGMLPKVPIYLDGMVKKALKIYRHNAIYLKKEVQRRILTSDDDPFKNELYKYPATRSREDVVNGGPCIILTTSGMINGGPVFTYLKKLGGDSNNKLILVGYQAQGTRGRALAEGQKKIEVDGEKIEVKMPVVQASFSGHSDYKELINFARAIKGLEKIFLVHGEANKLDELREGLEKACKKARVEIPSLGETLEC